MKLWLKSLLWPLQLIDDILPRQGMIFDLGCGDGFVSQYLAQSSRHRHIIGIDSNRQRIIKAQKLTRRLPNLSFKYQDILKVNLSLANACLLSDVLHHISLPAQQLLLQRIGRQLRPGGICLIKDVNSQDVLRSKLSSLWDWLLYPQDQINYFAAPELIKIMTKLGFQVKFRAVTPWFPGSVNLFTCIKQ